MMQLAVIFMAIAWLDFAKVALMNVWAAQEML